MNKALLPIAAFLGLSLRILLLFLLPGEIFYKSDHLIFWSWWKNSIEKGLLNSYGYKRKDLCFTYDSSITVRAGRNLYGPDRITCNGGRASEAPGRLWKTLPINYPPLSAYIIHLQGLAHRSLDSRMEPLTSLSWVIYESPAFLADLILALGCMAVIRRFRGARWGFAAFLLTFFSPGIILASVLWGQCDSWFLAAAVWSVYFCLAERWTGSGILWGLAFLIKAQALIIVPAILYFFLTRQSIKSLIHHSLAALLTILALTLPFMVRSGLAWFENSFIANLRGTILPYTTLNGFNLWMLDILLGKGDFGIFSTLFGITRKNWGGILTGTGVIFSILACRRTYGKDIRALPLCSALTFASIFLFSTQVHERYVLYILPFLAISVCAEKRYRDIFIGYSILSIFEMTSHFTAFNLFTLQREDFTGHFMLTALSLGNLYLFFSWLIEVWHSGNSDSSAVATDNV